MAVKLVDEQTVHDGWLTAKWWLIIADSGWYGQQWFNTSPYWLEIISYRTGEAENGPPQKGFYREGLVGTAHTGRKVIERSGTVESVP